MRRCKQKWFIIATYLHVFCTDRRWTQLLDKYRCAFSYSNLSSISLFQALNDKLSLPIIPGRQWDSRVIFHVMFIICTLNAIKISCHRQPHHRCCERQRRIRGAEGVPDKCHQWWEDKQLSLTSTNLVPRVVSYSAPVAREKGDPGLVWSSVF